MLSAPIFLEWRSRPKKRSATPTSLLLKKRSGTLLSLFSKKNPNLPRSANKILIYILIYNSSGNWNYILSATTFLVFLSTTLSYSRHLDRSRSNKKFEFSRGVPGCNIFLKSYLQNNNHLWSHFCHLLLGYRASK